jgi:transglutaminase-like putative cysteine protease
LNFQVQHVTRYSYESPVFLEPHAVRLKPVTDAGQRLESFNLHVQPEPAGMSQILEFEGNEATLCWFEGTFSELLVTTSSVVSTSRVNPFEYLSIGETCLPYRYTGQLATASMPFRAASGHPAVRRLGEQIAADVGGDAIAFPSAVAAEVRRLCRLIVRPEGEPLAAGETLSRGQGSCRDLAVVFMDVCRAMGFAARFVSGYHVVPGAEDQDLHAWAEVYLEGGGWRGFDPTTGLAIGEDHITIARAALPRNAAPVTGSFRGSATARLENTVSTTLVPRPGLPLSSQE